MLAKRLNKIRTKISTKIIRMLKLVYSSDSKMRIYQAPFWRESVAIKLTFIGAYENGVQVESDVAHWYNCAEYHMLNSKNGKRELEFQHRVCSILKYIGTPYYVWGTRYWDSHKGENIFVYIMRSLLKRIFYLLLMKGFGIGFIFTLFFY